MVGFAIIMLIVIMCVPNFQRIMDFTVVFTVSITSFSVGLALVVLTGVMSRLGLALISCERLEVCVTTIFAFGFALSYGCDIWYAGQIGNLDPYILLPVRSENGCFTYTDTRVLMINMTLLLATHVLLTLRWIALLPLQIVCLSLYALIVATGSSPEHSNNRYMNFVILFGYVIILSLGKRSMETYERDAAANLIEEKARRFQSEFRLSQHESSSLPSHEATSEKSTRQSAASTTGTGNIFADGTAWHVISALGIKEHWLIDSSELLVQDSFVLGQGRFGRVIGASYHGVDVAVKYPWIEEQADLSVLLSLLQEIRVLRHLRHPSIIGLIGACIDIEHSTVGLVLEMVDGDSLDEFVRHELGPPNQTLVERTQLICGIGFGLQYLHSRQPRIVHGDLKPSNVLVSAAGVEITDRILRTKIIDFGLSRVLTRNVRPLGGTPQWMAPEVFVGKEAPAVSADIYSFGKVTFFVLTGTVPHCHLTDDEILSALACGRLPKPCWPRDDNIARTFRSFVEMCLDEVPECRSTISDLMNLSILKIDETKYLDCLAEVAAAHSTRNSSTSL
eukprot:TRINITY_DN3732_c0_g1_i5.p1 TRINITY_DN3732_c0_g1~~TRINITY_DN3732_c0_g1_i5.p1  ORF type:complete len:623 (-),score=55.45 TRINITY_DN3732_c0_g1_i5:390-2078(-)